MLFQADDMQIFDGKQFWIDRADCRKQRYLVTSPGECGSTAEGDIAGSPVDVGSIVNNDDIH
jgi:hypothetical protein